MLALFESEETSRNNFKYIADSIERYLYTPERQYKVETCAGVYVFDPKEHSDSDINHLLDYANIAQKKAKAILGSNSCSVTRSFGRVKGEHPESDTE